MEKLKYDENSLIEYLKISYVENKKVPTAKDFNKNPKYPCSRTYIKKFGSWNNALKKANLSINKIKSYDEHTELELLEYIKTFNKEEKRAPTQRDFIGNQKYPSFEVYQKRFGSWNNAIKKAGLNINHEYTDEQLIVCIKSSGFETGKIPTVKDFSGNPKYPNFTTFIRRFGTWTNTLKHAGYDIDKLIKNGMLECEYHKGRLFEMIIRDSFKNTSVDLSGIKYSSPYDGICPTGKIYDAKSSGFNKNGWEFNLLNKEIEKIDFIYLGAFDKEYRLLMYVWLVPASFLLGKTSIWISNRKGEYNINNMKKYDITYKFKELI